MDKKEVMTKIEKMPIEEKLAMLCETDKAYIRGYIDKAVSEQKRIINFRKERTVKGSEK